MNTKARVFCAAVCWLMLISTSRSQNATQPLRLQHLVSAKIVGEGKDAKVIMMVESFRREKRRVEMTTKVFLVQDDGTEKVAGEPAKRSRVTTSIKSAGLKPTTVNASEIKFFDLDGKVVTLDDATQRLNQLKSVFLFDAGAKPGKLPPVIRAAFNKDCLLLMTDGRIRQRNINQHADPFGGDPFGGGADPFN